MREILFRGKRADSGEWVYGVPIKKALVGSRDGYYPKMIPECDGIHQTVYSVDINEESIGEYAGLCDKNGTRIFEGDIVKVENALVRGIFAVEYGISACFIVSHGERRYFLGGCNSEVIGNIYDNPELLTE